MIRTADTVVLSSSSGYWDRLCLSLTTVDSSSSVLCVDCLLSCLRHSWLRKNVSYVPGTRILVALSSLSVDLWYLPLWWLLMCNMVFCHRVIQCFVTVLYLVLSCNNSKSYNLLFITNLSFWRYAVFSCGLAYFKYWISCLRTSRTLCHDTEEDTLSSKLLTLYFFSRSSPNDYQTFHHTHLHRITKCYLPIMYSDKQFVRISPATCHKQSLGVLSSF